MHESSVIPYCPLALIRKNKIGVKLELSENKLEHFKGKQAEAAIRRHTEALIRYEQILQTAQHGCSIENCNAHK